MDGTIKFGWFKQAELHGYGYSCDTDKRNGNSGLFENGNIRESRSDVRWYDIDLDLIAKEMKFDNYFVYQQDVIDQLTYDIENIPNKLRKVIEDAI